jgi:excisionase family DNA binding protein
MTDDTATHDPNAYITIKEASRISGLDVSGLRAYARRGRLKAVKVGRDWLTTRRWLQEYLNSRLWSKD